MTGTSYPIGTYITFKNSATIVGSDVSYITGGSTSNTPFVNNNSALTLHFINVKFLNVNAKNLLELDGTVYLDNCTFDNVQTATGHNSVIYNTNNLMYLTGCNITNCHTGYGAVSNYNSGSTTSPVMYVDDCRFINNSASVEPGAINNCGILYVNNSEFDGNHANWWAGAIHTHTNAQTEIENTNFRRNTAGWNGGALFTYSKLKIKNCTFEDNNCTTNNGGGAIGAYNYGSGYNITIDSSRFNYNTNLCYAYTNISTTSVGRGGAISVLNGGYLTVYNSNFTGNYAKIGQAIAAATYNYENGTGGNPHIKICNNKFTDHTATGIDTVVITGNDYIFNNNVFINSYQNTIYTGTGNTYNSAALPGNLNSKLNLKTKLRATNTEILSDYQDHDVVYVNVSSDKDAEDDNVHGQSWDDAYGGLECFVMAINYLHNNGIIYIADGRYNEDYDYEYSIAHGNFTMIGQGPKTNIEKIITTVYGGSDQNSTHNFINLSFTGKDFGINANFINCTFLGSISISKGLTYHDPNHVVEYGYAQTYFMNFNNCVFKDVNTTNALVTLYKYGAVNFTNCIFENITADSIVYRNDINYFEEDGISFKNCTFTNCKYNGIADSLANFDDAVVIEDCTYDSEVALGTTEVNGHYYINATKLKVTAVGTSISIKSNENNVIVNLTDVNGNPVANAGIIYSIAGTNTSATTGADGTFTLSNLKGIVNITVYYSGNESYLASNKSDNFIFKYNTAVSSAVNGDDILIILKDDENNPIANANVIYTVNGIDYNATTDENGTVTVSNLKGKFAFNVLYKGDTLHTASNASNTFIFKYGTKITAKKVTATYNVAKNLVITLKDENGIAIAVKKVTVKVGSIRKTLTTNAKGQATLKVSNLLPKTYSATVTYAGDDTHIKSSVKVKVVVKKATLKVSAKAKKFKKSLKTKKYSIVLKNNVGKVLKKTKVTLKIKGKTFKAYTNSKGIATFKITKLTKKGKYNAYIKFAGSKYYNSLNKKVKITLK